MADNTVLNTGVGGDTIASDDIGGVKYPRSKIVIGADNVNDGDVSAANPLPITGTLTAVTAITNAVTVNAHAVTNAGTFAVQVDGAALTALQLLDNAISGSEMQVDVVAALPAGTNNIGDVDVLTVPAPLSTTGSGVEATALRVTIATDSTGVLSVDDNGSTISIDDGGGIITVDGTVAVTGTFWQSTQPVSLASVPSHPVTNAGTFAVQVTSAPTTAVTGTFWQTTQPVSGTFWQATQPVSGTVTANLSATDNAVLDAIAASVAGATPAGTNNIGDVDVLSLPALPAGSNNIGDVDVLTIAAGTNLVGDVGLRPRTTGGLTMHKTTSAATTNATAVKGSAGQVYNIQCFNVNAGVRYLKLYNKATAPTVGTDTPVKTLAIPGNTAGAGFVIGWPQGLAFSLGIGFALTTEATDAGTTGVALNEITVNLDYA